MSSVLGLIDLDLLDDLISDNATGIAMYLGAQAMLLAVMIAIAVKRRVTRSPVERLLHRRFGV